MMTSVPTLLRRIAVPLLLTGGLVLGPALPSWASFIDTVAVQTTIATPSVVVPGTITAPRAQCSGNWATVAIDWNASTAPRVTGYKVRLYLNAAWQDVATVGSGTTAWSGITDDFYVTNYSMTFTVWTLTEYGWTAESAHSARITC